MGKFKKNNSGKEIRQNMLELNKLANRVEKSKRGQQCECTHKAYGKPCLDSDTRSDGTPVFRCHSCGKEIIITRKSIKELEVAFDTIDQQCDAAKIIIKDGDPLLDFVIQYQKDSLRMRDYMKKLMSQPPRKNRPNNDMRGNVRINWGR